MRSLPHDQGPRRRIDYGGRVKIALMDSGIGLLAATAAVRRLRPDADLILSLDPDGMPWGPRTPRTSPHAPSPWPRRPPRTARTP